ncbi:MAG: hypothetical protein ABSG99_03905 [Sedimentisphaerales bacterium]
MPSVNVWIKNAIQDAPDFFDEKEIALGFLSEKDTIEGKMTLAQALLKKVSENSECPEAWKRLVADHLIPAEEAMRILLPTHRDHVIHSANLYLLGLAMYLKMIRTDKALLSVLVDIQFRDAQALFSWFDFQYDCYKRIIPQEISLPKLRELIEQRIAGDAYNFNVLSEDCPTCGISVEDLINGTAGIIDDNDFFAMHHALTGLEHIDALFRRRWGQIAIMHDCAYPLELATRQIDVYLNNTVSSLGCPFSQCPTPFSIVFNRLCDLINLPLVQILCTPLVNKHMYSDNSIQLIATNINHKLHVEYSPESLGRMMLDSLERGLNVGKLDHGVFSALLMLRWMDNELRAKLKTQEHGQLVRDNPNRRINEVYPASAIEFFYIECVDAAAAVYLHNTKRYIDFFKQRPIDYRQHPYAWLLFLCDQLQEWLRPSGETLETGTEFFLGAEKHKIILDEGPQLYFDFPEKGEKINDEIRHHLRLFGESFIKTTT